MYLELARIPHSGRESTVFILGFRNATCDPRSICKRLLDLAPFFIRNQCDFLRQKSFIGARKMGFKWIRILSLVS